MVYTRIKRQTINTITLAVSIIVFVLVTLWVIISFAHQNHQDRKSLKRFSLIEPGL